MIEDDIILLTERIKKLETDLAAAKGNYAGVMELLMEHSTAKSVTEDGERKAKYELEKEKTRSHALGTDVDWLKEVL